MASSSHAWIRASSAAPSVAPRRCVSTARTIRSSSSCSRASRSSISPAWARCASASAAATISRSAPIFGQLEGLRSQGPDHAPHFGGVVDRMVPNLAGPGRVEPLAGAFEGLVRLPGAAARTVESRRQIRDLRRASGLQSAVDRPRIAAGFGDERRDAYEPEPHRIAGRCAAHRASMRANSSSPRRLTRFARGAGCGQPSAGAAVTDGPEPGGRRSSAAKPIIQLFISCIFPVFPILPSSAA